MKKVILCLLVFLFIPLVSACEKSAQVTKYDIDMEYFNGSVQFSEIVTFSAKTEDYSVAYFNFYPLAYQEGERFSPVNDGHYATVDILEISAHGKKLDYEIEDSFIKIKLGKAYGKNDRLSIKFVVNIKLPEGEYRMAKTEKTVNLGNMFATLAVYDGEYIKCDYGVIGDPFVSEIADYTVSVTVPGEYVVAGGGVPTSTDVGDSKTRYSYKQNNIRDFALSLSENYQVTSKKWGNKSVYYYFYDDPNAENTVNCAVSVLEYFSKTFGEYPYDIFCISQTPFLNGGMEYPLIVFLSDSLTYENYLYALAHEIAHQWWYGIVGNNQIEESYLDESLAEYSSYLFFDEHSEYGIDGNSLVTTAAKAVEACERAIFEVNSNFIPSVKKPLSEFKSEYEYVNMVYSKGLIMFKSLENLMGRQYVKDNLKSYFNKNAFKIAKTDNLLNAFSNDKPFLNSFIDGRTRVFL